MFEKPERVYQAQWRRYGKADTFGHGLEGVGEMARSFPCRWSLIRLLIAADADDHDVDVGNSVPVLGRAFTSSAVLSPILAREAVRVGRRCVPNARQAARYR